ncbi:MAG: hypothetical protein OXH78_02145, partial [Acidimicrobiaceae bacterium]|nr:hypothetical protein [Acidimicrobiaceae bacterium]
TTTPPQQTVPESDQLTVSAGGGVFEGQPAVFTIRSNRAAGQPELEVSVVVEGEGDYVSPFDLGAKIVLIPAGETTVDYEVATVDRVRFDVSGSVKLTLHNADGHVIAEPSSASVTVYDLGDRGVDAVLEDESAGESQAAQGETVEDDKSAVVAVLEESQSGVSATASALTTVPPATIALVAPVDSSTASTPVAPTAVTQSEQAIEPPPGNVNQDQGVTVIDDGSEEPLVRALQILLILMIIALMGVMLAEQQRLRVQQNDVDGSGRVEIE